MYSSWPSDEALSLGSLFVRSIFGEFAVSIGAHGEQTLRMRFQLHIDFTREFHIFVEPRGFYPPACLPRRRVSGAPDHGSGASPSAHRSSHPASLPRQGTGGGASKNTACE